MLKIRCVVERITYQNPESGYSIMTVKVKESWEKHRQLSSAVTATSRPFPKRQACSMTKCRFRPSSETMRALLKAIPVHMRLIMDGDIDQLPSVGAGNVLRDVIDSGKIPGSRTASRFAEAEPARALSQFDPAQSVRSVDNPFNAPDAFNLQKIRAADCSPEKK